MFLEMAYVLDQVRYRVECRTLTRWPMIIGPLSGHVFIHELFHEHEVRAYENLLMTPRMFLKLRDVLIDKDLVKHYQPHLYRTTYNLPSCPRLCCV
ncbi:hypothetical protein QJS04_geneDACA021127 [Acorus gramineus]|uniref:DUF8040 domain-containing protein n=1 Tax=Acorus gramineus TaxID=55184 RepID=A0AAV9BKS5_ACOGR|nr:hypothetical protein QJS04_geneDACA021127 [Acorus gramineus]